MRIRVDGLGLNGRERAVSLWRKRQTGATRAQAVGEEREEILARRQLGAGAGADALIARKAEGREHFGRGAERVGRAERFWTEGPRSESGMISPSSIISWVPFFARRLVVWVRHRLQIGSTS